MSFKTKGLGRTGIAFALLVLAMVSGCNLGPRSNTPGGTSLGLDSSGGGCFSGGTNVIGNYFDGLDTDDSMAKMLDCASSSLQLFMTRVQGSVPGQYSPGELRSFIQFYFVKDFTISDVLLGQAMLIKQALVGGSTLLLTLDEVKKISTIIDILKRYSIALRPYMPLTAPAIAGRSEQSVEDGIALLQQGVTELASTFGKSTGAYSFTDLDTLLREFQSTPEPQSLEGTLFEFRNRIELFKAVKAALIDYEPDVISAENIATILTTGTDVYAGVLRMSILARSYPDWSSGQGREHFMRVVRQAFALVNASIARHPNGVITLEELNRLVDVIPPELLPFKPDTIKSILKPVFTRIFGDAESQGITHSATTKIADAVNHWAEGQRYLEALFAKMDPSLAVKGDNPPQYQPKDLLAYQPYQLFPSRSDLTLPMVEESVDLQDMLKSEQVKPLLDRPFFHGNDVQASFYMDPTDLSHSFHDLSERNWTHVIATVIQTAYRMDRSKAPSENSDRTDYVGYHQLYEDVKPLGVELKMIAPDDDEIAILSRFREANIFTPAGNGDNCLDTHEIEQMTTLVLSGSRGFMQIYGDMLNECPTGALDSSGQKTIEAVCFRKKYFASIDKYWAQMPRLLESYRSQTAPDLHADFERNLELAVRGNQGPWIASGDIAGFATLPQYIESLFYRFNTENNGDFNLDDSKAAFPIFKNLLNDAVKQMSHSRDDIDPRLLNAVFTYLLAWGEPPPDGWLAQDLTMVSWLQNRALWPEDVHADRAKLLGIFASMTIAQSQARDAGMAKEKPHVDECVPVELQSAVSFRK